MALYQNEILWWCAITIHHDGTVMIYTSWWWGIMTSYADSLWYHIYMWHHDESHDIHFRLQGLRWTLRKTIPWNVKWLWGVGQCLCDADHGNSPDIDQAPLKGPPIFDPSRVKCCMRLVLDLFRLFFRLAVESTRVVRCPLAEEKSTPKDVMAPMYVSIVGINQVVTKVCDALLARSWYNHAMRSQNLSTFFRDRILHLVVQETVRLLFHFIQIRLLLLLLLLLLILVLRLG